MSFLSALQAPLEVWQAKGQGSASPDALGLTKRFAGPKSL